MKRLTAALILQTLCDAFGVTLAELRAPNRTRRLAYLRRLAAYTLYEDGCLWHSEIARQLNRDPSVIISGHRKFRLELRVLPEAAADLAAVRARLLLHGKKEGER